MLDSIYDFKINSLQSKEINFADFKDKVVLIVNTASKCGFTPQYAGLQKLHDTYKDQGLIIVGFPCNQFGGQEPGDNKEISENCLVNYGVSFSISEKIDVNGENQSELFNYLKKALPGILGSKEIKWNFTKFLIDRSGKPVKRFSPTTEPEDIESDIKKLLDIV
jgi:glutathione peroxidase